MNYSARAATVGTASVLLFSLGASLSAPTAASTRLSSTATERSWSQFATPLSQDYLHWNDFELPVHLSEALGEFGVERLNTFRTLDEGWDGQHARSLDLESLRRLSSFFSATGLAPAGLAIFMTPEGFLVVNWHDAENRLVELEFLNDAIAYYLEGTEEEGYVPAGDAGAARLLRNLKSIGAA